MTAKELKTKSNMGYTPYKMKADNNDPMTKNYGAVAPGKMRAFGTKDSDMPDGISTTPGKYAGGVGSSPAKGWFNKLVGGAKKLAGKALDPLGLKNKAQKMLGGGGNAKLEARVSALEAGAGESSGEATAVGGDAGVTGGAKDKIAEMMKNSAASSLALGGAGGGAGGGKMDMITKAQSGGAGAQEEGMDPSAVAYRKKK
jgi:hypothetical protein